MRPQSDSLLVVLTCFLQVLIASAEQGELPIDAHAGRKAELARDARLPGSVLIHEEDLSREGASCWAVVTNWPLRRCVLRVNTCAVATPAQADACRFCARGNP